MSIVATEREAPAAQAGLGLQEQASVSRGVSSWAFFIAVGTFATTVGNPGVLASLPLKAMLKGKLQATPEQMSIFFGVASLAWYVKPLLGLALDRKAGAKAWRTTMAVSALLACLLWACLALAPLQYGALLAIVVALNIPLVMASNVLGGIMVARGRDRSATGRLSAASMASRHVGYLIAGPLGGILASFPLGATAAVGGAMAGLLLAVALVWRDMGVGTRAREGGAEAGLWTVLTNRTFWTAAGIVFLVELAPGFDTPLFYVQTDELKFSMGFLGNLQLAQSAAGLLAAGAFAVVCRRLPLRWTLAGGIVASAITTLLFYLYRGPNSAMAITILSGAVGMLAFLPVLDLAARATPGGIVCAGFALMMSMRNIASSLSDWAGSKLYGQWGVSFHDLIWISALTTAVTLLALPFLPAGLLKRKDGEAAGAGE